MHAFLLYISISTIYCSHGGINMIFCTLWKVSTTPPSQSSQVFLFYISLLFLKTFHIFLITFRIFPQSFPRFLQKCKKKLEKEKLSCALLSPNIDSRDFCDFGLEHWENWCWPLWHCCGDTELSWNLENIDNSTWWKLLCVRKELDLDNIANLCRKICKLLKVRIFWSW